MSEQQLWGATPPENAAPYGSTPPPPPPPQPQLPPAPAAAWAPPPPAAPAWNPAPAPPAPVQYGSAYCRSCGNAMHPQAAMCMHCGVATGYHAPLAPAMPKVKSTGLVLAVLFGLFGWLYTYKRDAWKFWLNLCMAVITLGLWGLVAWVWVIID